MIPLTFLYDEYIYRPKLSEQKNPFEYIVPPPASGVGTINDSPSGASEKMFCSFLMTKKSGMLVFF